MNSGIIIIGIIILALIGYIVYSYKKIKNQPETTNNENIKIITDSTFASEIKNGITLVDFWASWCMPCKVIAPILNEVAEEIGTKAKIGKLDVDKNPASSSKYQVRGIPTMILFKNGVEVNRFVGVKQKDFLLKEIRKVL